MKHLILLLSIIALSSCSVAKYSQFHQNKTLDGYHYFYVNETSSLTSGHGLVLGGSYGIGGGSTSNSVNPADVITGYMVKHGFVRVASDDEKHINQTIRITCGESGRISYGLGSSALEMTIQFIDASNEEIILTSTAAGFGETLGDDVRIAIKHCMENIFGK